MTPEQREAAIDLIYKVTNPGYNDVDEYRRDAEDVLDSLQSKFVVIAKDDVTEERAYDEPGFGWQEVHRDSGDTPTHARLVTHWEPIEA